MSIKTKDIVLLAATAPCSLDGARSWANPVKRPRMKRNVRARIQAAADLLGLIAPEAGQ
jgi:hypothetical protein